MALQGDLLAAGGFQGELVVMSMRGGKAQLVYGERITNRCALWVWQCPKGWACGTRGVRAGLVHGERITKRCVLWVWVRAYLHERRAVMQQGPDVL